MKTMTLQGGGAAKDDDAGLASEIHRQFGRPEGLLGRVAGWIMANRPSNRDRNRWTVELLGIRPDDQVLEIGYGPGLSIALAASRLGGGRVTGIDHSAVMYAQAAARNAAQIRAGRVELLVGGLELLPAFSARFDKVFAVNVFQFLADRKQALGAIRLALKPGGVLGVTFMPRGSNATPGDADRFAGKLAKEVLDAGFRSARTEKLDLKPMPAVCVLALS